MESHLARSTDGSPLPPNTPPSIGSSLVTLFAFFALVTTALFVVTYPVAVVALLVGAVVAVGAIRALARLARRHRGSLRRIDIPGIGTVEYRLRRS